MQTGKIPYGRQTVEKDDIAAVTETLKSDFLTQGPKVPQFEETVSSYCGAKFACAVNSGTSALHVAYLALGVRPGSRVWTTPVTFVATANAALMCGAEVSFIDVDPLTGNMSVTALAASLQTAARDHELPDVVTVVHLGGLPCGMKKISELAALYHFRVVEEIAIDGKPIFRLTGLRPFRCNVQRTVSLLQKDNVRNHFGSGIGLERIVG